MYFVHSVSVTYIPFCNSSARLEIIEPRGKRELSVEITVHLPNVGLQFHGPKALALGLVIQFRNPSILALALPHQSLHPLFRADPLSPSAFLCWPLSLKRSFQFTYPSLQPLFLFDLCSILFSGPFGRLRYRNVLNLRNRRLTLTLSSVWVRSPSISSPLRLFTIA